MRWRSKSSGLSRSIPLWLVLKRPLDRKSTRLNSSHPSISYAVFCLKKKTLLGHQLVFQHRRNACCPSAVLTSFLDGLLALADPTDASQPLRLALLAVPAGCEVSHGS